MSHMPMSHENARTVSSSEAACLPCANLVGGWRHVTHVNESWNAPTVTPSEVACFFRAKIVGGWIVGGWIVGGWGGWVETCCTRQ